MVSSFVLVVVLLALTIVLSVTADWPSERHEGTVLVIALILGLLPLILVVLGSLTGGGSVEFLGIALHFPEARPERREISVPPRMGLPPGEPLGDASTRAVVEVLKQAVHTEVAVVDLADGTTWWDTRLLVFCAGAARIGRPRAVVLTANVADTGPGTFLGWAPPDELRDRLLSRPALRRAYDRGRAWLRQWELAEPRTAGELPDRADEPPGKLTQPRLPFTPVSPATAQPGHPWLIYQPPDYALAPLAPELLLAAAMGDLEGAGRYTPVDLAEARALFDAKLRRIAAEVDAPAKSDGFWARRVLDAREPFVPLVRRGRYAGMLPRERAINDVLGTLIGYDASTRDGGQEASRAPG
ncbi:hypothetical protein CD790_22490 [Streptomyces sp. SAJ15]|nr:hypothetical protein CD790_22490 [Streptomyces sp. SAJ15]